MLFLYSFHPISKDLFRNIPRTLWWIPGVVVKNMDEEFMVYVQTEFFTLFQASIWPPCIEQNQLLRLIMFGASRGLKTFVDCPQIKYSTICPTAVHRETVTFLLQDTVLPCMQVKSKLVSLLVLYYKSICSFCLLVMLRCFTNIMPLGYLHPVEYIP